MFDYQSEWHCSKTIVFNCRYTPVSDELIAERIEREMAKRPDVQEVLMVTKRSELIHFPR